VEFTSSDEEGDAERLPLLSDIDWEVRVFGREGRRLGD
jgi:hypothetical protein